MTFWAPLWPKSLELMLFRASRAHCFGPSPLGPRPLNLSDVSVETDLAAAVRGVIDEACFGETLGAAEAQAAAELATDVNVRRICAEIAVDEARHAKLAWRALQWMLHAGDDSLKEVASEALESAVVRHFSQSFPAEDEALLAHGILTGEVRAEVHGLAFEEVVRPCADALGLRCPQLPV